MASLKKRMTGLLQRKDSGSGQNDDLSDSSSVVSLIRRFCLSAATADDTAALVAITELIFSNPSQAEEGARCIRKILADKSKAKTGELYNAAMLILVLARHQDSAAFTTHMDDRFVGTVRIVLRDDNRDTISTKMLIKDMIGEFELTIDGKQPARNQGDQSDNELRAARWATDAGISRMLALRNDPKNWVWLREQQRQLPGPQPQAQRTPNLPPPHELSERLNEAESSAQMLIQMIQVNPTDVLRNDLIREFQHRCVGARNSLETYAALASDNATWNNIDATKLKVVNALSTYDDAVRRNRDRLPPASRTQGADSTLSPTPLSTRQPPPRPASNTGSVSPVDTTNGQDNPFDDQNESTIVTNTNEYPLWRPTQTSSQTTPNGERPALSLTNKPGGISTSSRNSTSRDVSSSSIPDLATKSEEPVRYRF